MMNYMLFSYVPNKQLAGPIGFHSIFFFYYGSPVNRLVTDILQNIFLCVQQKKKKTYRFETRVM